MLEMSATDKNASTTNTNNKNNLEGAEKGVQKTTEKQSKKMTLALCLQRVLFFGIGGVLLTVGILMSALWPFIFNSILKSQLTLTDGSHTYDMWVETPLPMYLDIYLFNWTNPDDTFKNGSKPILQEVGPFVFSEHHTKDHIVWNEDGTVTYQQYRKWVFHPEMSKGSLNDTITSANVITMTIGNLCKKLNKLEKIFVSELLNFEENLVVTKNVSELLFNGYSDAILNIINVLKNKFKLPISVDMNKFGWFYKRNMSDTADGIFTMETGQSDISQLGNVFKWNNKSKLPYYSGTCGQIQGSLGELWPPKTAKEDSISLFAPEICSNLLLSKTEKIKVHNLTGVNFASTEATFDNGTHYSDMSCYCPVGSPCPSYGLRDVSACRGGAPVLISHPHFYLADPSYLEAVEGLHPDPEKHKFEIALEENTGIPLRVDARLQISLHLGPVPNMRFFEKLPNIYMPMIWFNQRAKMTEEMAASIHPLITLSDYGIWALVGTASLGGLLVAIGLFLTRKRLLWACESIQQETLLNN